MVKVGNRCKSLSLQEQIQTAIRHPWLTEIQAQSGSFFVRTSLTAQKGKLLLEKHHVPSGLTSSTDDGKTWTEPREITATTKNEDWTWYATGSLPRDSTHKWQIGHSV